jgi:hypothetical protein
MIPWTASVTFALTSNPTALISFVVWAMSFGPVRYAPLSSRNNVEGCHKARCLTAACSRRPNARARLHAGVVRLAKESTKEAVYHGCQTDRKKQTSATCCLRPWTMRHTPRPHGPPTRSLKSACEIPMILSHHLWACTHGHALISLRARREPPSSVPLAMPTEGHRGGKYQTDRRRAPARCSPVRALWPMQRARRTRTSKWGGLS